MKASQLKKNADPNAYLYSNKPHVTDVDAKKKNLEMTFSLEKKRSKNGAAFSYFDKLYEATSCSVPHRLENLLKAIQE